MWKVSLAATNPQQSITQLCSLFIVHSKHAHTGILHSVLKNHTLADNENIILYPTQANLVILFQKAQNSLCLAMLSSDWVGDSQQWEGPEWCHGPPGHSGTGDQCPEDQTCQQQYGSSPSRRDSHHGTRQGERSQTGVCLCVCEHTLPHWKRTQLL